MATILLTAYKSMTDEQWLLWHDILSSILAQHASGAGTGGLLPVPIECFPVSRYVQGIACWNDGMLEFHILRLEGKNQDENLM